MSLQDFRPDPATDVPPYRQLRRRIAADIAAGEIAVGERLPSVRALAAAVSMAANTVAKVYKELEAEGLVETRGRAGTVVTPLGASSPKAVRDAAARLAAAAAKAGMADDAVLTLVRSELAAHA